MTKELTDVKAFMEKAGRPIYDKPTYPTTEQALLRCNLILEEALEFVRGMGCEVEIENGELKAFFEMDGKTANLIECFDGLLDLLYVTYGAAIELGFSSKLLEGWNEVQRSNMTKFIDGYKDHKGKWVKGKSYSPANLKSILNEI